MYLFKLQCEKSDKLLREKLLQKKAFEGELFMEERQLKSENIAEDEKEFSEDKPEEKVEYEPDKVFVEDFDNNIDFDSYDESEQDISTKENKTLSHTKVKEFHCEICHKEFSRNDLLLRHKIAHAIKMEEPKVKKSDKQPFVYADVEVKTEEFLYSCPHCDILFVHKDDFDLHLKETHEKSELTITCDVCNEKFLKLSHKTRHMKKVHLLEKQYKCPTCEKSFYKKEQLEHHANSHLGKKPHTCDICLKGM